MNLQDYIQSKGYIRVKPSIYTDKWVARIMLYGWQHQGQDGAAKYLVRFGKSIGLPKVLMLARCAEDEHYPEVAKGFYMYAARLEGIKIDSGMRSEMDALLKKRDSKLPPVKVHDTGYSDFPAMFQPGKADFTSINPFMLTGLIGERLFAFVTPTQTLYQIEISQKEGTLQQSLEFRVDEQLQALAKVFGNLVLLVNLGWVDFAATEYATAEESLKANADLGFETFLPEPILTIVECLYTSQKASVPVTDFDAVLGDEFVRARSAA